MPNIQSTCDVSTVFGGGDLPVAGALVQVGDQVLVPSPFVNLVLEKYRLGEKVIGGVLKVTLNGTVVASSFDCVVMGQGANGTGIRDILKLGQTKGCVCVVIKCSDGKELVNGYGRIISVSASEGNHPTWVNMAPYSIELEVYDNQALSDGRPVIPDDKKDNNASQDDDYVLKQVSEQLSWSINDDTFNWGSPSGSGNCFNNYANLIDGFGNRHIKLNFSMSAVGVAGPSSSSSSGCLCLAAGSGSNPSVPSGTYGLKAAEKYLRKRFELLGSLADTLKCKDPLFDATSYASGTPEILNAFNSYFGGDSYLDFRTIEIDPVEHSIQLNGEIIFRPSGCLNSNVFTTLNVEHQLTTAEENITITGNVIGLIHNEFDRIIQLKNSNDTNFSNCALRTRINNAENFLSRLYDPDKLKTIAGCYVKKYPYPKGYIEDDCQYSASSGCSTTATTPPPPELCDMRIVGSNITRNINSGEINFSFSLSNAPNCDIIGASKVDINITHDKPHDNIVEIIIPGRGSRGPLIQNLCCNSAEKYDISVDAILNRKTCTFDIKPTTINQLRNCAEKALEKIVNENNVNVNCWFKVNDSETIGNTSYKLSRTYVKPSCP